MKILHVLNYSLPQLNGYTIRSKYIVDFQKALGMEPIVVTSTRQKIGNPDIQKETIYDTPYFRTNMPVRNLSSNLPYIREFSSTARLRSKIDEIVQNYNPSVIHAHSPSLCGLAASKVCKKLDIPCAKN